MGLGKIVSANGDNPGSGLAAFGNSGISGFTHHNIGSIQEIGMIDRAVMGQQSDVLPDLFCLFLTGKQKMDVGKVCHILIRGDLLKNPAHCDNDKFFIAAAELFF